MRQGVFIVGTDTDVGKTFITATIIKKLREANINAGYYKAVLSGAYYDGDELIPGDAQVVLSAGNIDENYDKCVSYILEKPLSPHLASRIENIDIQLERIGRDYKELTKRYEYIIVEGSGGVVCPIKITDTEVILLEDIIKLLKLPTIIVARAGLGTINHTVLTAYYMEQKGIQIKGIILNGYEEYNSMHIDNKKTIERLTGIKVIATVPEGSLDDELEIGLESILGVYK